jgi:carbon storage regulator
MLVLTRKLMEKLFIGDNISVTVVRLEGGQVRLGIEAPREVSVVRAELVSPSAKGTTVTVAPSPNPSPEPQPVAASPRRSIRFPRVSVHETDSRRRGRFR